MILLRGHHLRLLCSYMQAKKSEFTLEAKKKRIIAAAIEDGHGKEFGLHIIEILERALDPKEKIMLTDTLDAICASCNGRESKRCREFIPYGISAACEDKSVLHYYGLKKRAYTSRFIKKVLSGKKVF